MGSPTVISFIIPCYRSEKTIRSVYDEIVSVLATRDNYAYEIIAINDCSPDGVLNVLRSIAEEDHSFRVLDLSKNFGKHGALMAGIAHAQGDLVCTLDDDGQCPVDELWKLVDAVEVDGYDCSTACYGQKRESAWKRVGSRVNSWIVEWLLDLPHGLKIENFCVFRRWVGESLLSYENPYPYVDGLIMRTTHNIRVIAMEERTRQDGQTTGFTLRKSISLFMNGLTAFSVKPLRVAAVLGFAFSVVGLLYGLFVVVRKLFDPAVLLGYSSIMAMMLFTSGVIMLILGMIGEYLGRIYVSINRSPQYIVRDSINIDSNLRYQKCCGNKYFWSDKSL